MVIDDTIGNGNGKEWEEPDGNPMGIRIGYKIVNGNGKELELTMWEWQGMGFYNKDWKKM